MTSSHARPLAALLAAAALALGTPAGAGAQGHTHTHGAPPATSSGTITSAVHPWTAADARFMSMMIGHHAQAVEMSRLAPTNGANSTVQRLAERIINAQEDEIAAMQTWLRDRGQPVPEPAATSAMHHGAGGHAGHAGGHDAGGHAAMPGMLTDAQMAQLRAARGPEFDRLFLALMIQHHRGAVSMVKELFGSYGAAQDETVFKFASDVSVDQTTEIERMQRMLADLTFGRP